MEIAMRHGPFDVIKNEFDNLKDSLSRKVITPKSDIKIKLGKKQYLFHTNRFGLYDSVNHDELNRFFKDIMNIALRYIRKGKNAPDLVAPVLCIPRLIVTGKQDQVHFYLCVYI